MAYSDRGLIGSHSLGMVPEYRPRLKTAFLRDWESMEKKSTFGLTPSQLGRLLAASVRTTESVDTMTDDQANERLLQKHLSRRLAEEPSFEKAMLSGAKRPISEVQLLLDRSVRETLFDPQCDIAILQAIKEHGKRLSATVTSGSETLIRRHCSGPGLPQSADQPVLA